AHLRSPSPKRLRSVTWKRSRAPVTSSSARESSRRSKRRSRSGHPSRSCPTFDVRFAREREAERAKLRERVDERRDVELFDGVVEEEHHVLRDEREGAALREVAIEEVLRADRHRAVH